ncbi:Z-ring formation inhibitor MciZ [Bacillus sp. S/N-304-OC-R1]|uniref:Z-ring formation inhibitor MciZ n=1 Tax=Bacillus sp. S/N-304-OC-R1 TaxID=2758034 RepID=UPI001C8EF483|nr:Z-ring formation inhibitor MciZ [Bacillus sp. S/N-304-OC-R1]MBY0122512.1 Z-ring formation inhibitor MciZ [Bacillus sp. S/N-304-OC-R1]
MKIHVHERGVLLVGKAWEIRQKLKEYSKEYQLVKDWVEMKRSTPINSERR